jgi:hypothetical protein
MAGWLQAGRRGRNFLSLGGARRAARRDGGKASHPIDSKAIGIGEGLVVTLPEKKPNEYARGLADAQGYRVHFAVKMLNS